MRWVIWGKREVYGMDAMWLERNISDGCHWNRRALWSQFISIRLWVLRVGVYMS